MADATPPSTFVSLPCPACPSNTLRAREDGLLECPLCGFAGELEVERPAPFTPAVPAFKELPVPQSIPTSLQGEAVTVTPAPAPSFHVPTSLKVLAGALVPILGALAIFLPVPFGPIAAVSAFIAAGLLGLSLPMPKFMAGRPLVPLALVPLLTTLSVALGQLAFTQPPESKAYFYLYAGACLCALLAGVAAPQPGQSLK